ncbi:hypothetical protein [Lewinella sp. W8]|uniref:hypothetical protein n=1 Tax=Lewinella sp. W8 TaxID=2528208 RepID=UPI0010678ECC|nr:hypothetical protein [Lewinella sp. W8]MTB49520.1 hypothetical protein [Lewinella sp. W8]
MKSYPCWRATSLLLCIWFLVGCGSEEQDAPAPVVLERGPVSLTVLPARGGQLSILRYRGEVVLEADTTNGKFLNGFYVAQDSLLASHRPLISPLTVVRQREHSLLMEGQPDARGIRPRLRIILGPEEDIGFTYWFSNEGLGALTSSVVERTDFPPDWTVQFSSAEFRNTGTKPLLSASDSTHLLALHPEVVRDTLLASVLDMPVVFQNERFRLEKHTATREYYRVLPGLSPLSIYPTTGGQRTTVLMTGDQRSVGYGETTNLRTRWVLRTNGKRE